VAELHILILERAEAGLNDAEAAEFALGGDEFGLKGFRVFGLVEKFAGLGLELRAGFQEGRHRGKIEGLNTSNSPIAACERPYRTSEEEQ